MTTITKTINHTVTNFGHTNSVNATIISSSGLNIRYLATRPGLLKLVQLILAAVSLGLVASLGRQENFTIYDDRAPVNDVLFAGDADFLILNGSALAVVLIIILSFVVHTNSVTIVARATNIEVIANLVLALLLTVAGVRLIWKTEQWTCDPNFSITVPPPSSDWCARRLMVPPNKHLNEEYMRLAAGGLTIINAVLCLFSALISVRKFGIPRTAL